MTKKYIKCPKCQKNAYKTGNWQVCQYPYFGGFPVRSKNGQIYCGDCYQNGSQCRVCEKSMANVDTYNHSGYGRRVDAHKRACEDIWQEVSFYCSEKCLKNHTSQEVAAWHKKLSQGYQKCSGCVELFEWLQERHEMNFPHACLLVNLVAKQGELCEIHQPNDRKQKAQNYWNSLSKEAKMTAIQNANKIVNNRIFADGDLTNEQLSEKEKVPPRIFYAFFASKCDICHESPCKDWKVRSDNHGGNNNENFASLVSSSTTGDDANNNNNSGIIVGCVVGLLLTITFAFVFYLIKKNKHK